MIRLLVGGYATTVTPGGSIGASVAASSSAFAYLSRITTILDASPRLASSANTISFCSCPSTREAIPENIQRMTMDTKSRHMRVLNGDDRLVVLNRVALSVVDSVQGKHATHIFGYKGKPITRMLKEKGQFDTGSGTRPQAYFWPPVRSCRREF